MDRLKRMMIDYEQSQPERSDQDILYARQKESIKRRSLLIVVGLTLLIWLMFAELELVITARGEIIESRDIERVQHLEGGILDEILVAEGDQVFKGQTLAVLQSFDTQSSLVTTQGEVEEAQMEMERLLALMETRELDLQSFDENHPRRLHHERSFSIEDKKNRSKDIAIMYEIRQAKEVLASMQTRLASSLAQKKLMQEQLRIKEQLYKEEIASYLDVIRVKIENMNMYREIQNLEEAILQKQLEYQSLEHRLVNERNIRNAEYMTKFTDTRKAYFLKSSMLPSVTDRVERLKILAPVDGFIDKISYNYLSAIISPGESFAEIAPLKDIILAEIKVQPKDIGHIEIGQSVRVKIDTYDFTKYGWIDGSIESISRYTQEEEKEKFFIAKVALDKRFLNRHGIDYEVLPAMEITGDIITGSRRVIEYVVKPVAQMISGAFNEQ